MERTAQPWALGREPPSKVGATSQPLGFPTPFATRFWAANGAGRAHKLAIRSASEIRIGSNSFRDLTCFEEPLRPPL